MTDREQARQQMFADLSYRPLHRGWAKLEILFGLVALAVSLRFLLADAGTPRDLALAGGIALFVLGGYLTLAGHRSHLYQSLNDQAAYLLWQIQQTNREPKHHEHPR